MAAFRALLSLPSVGHANAPPNGRETDRLDPDDPEKLADDGAIEKGVGRVHAAFTELKPEGIAGSLAILNAEMLRRVGRRGEFRENAPAEDGALFTECLHEAVGPLDRPRYVVPRYADDVCDTWLSSILPEILARYVRRRRRRLAKNKGLAATFGQHWNAHVSPGEPLYAYRGEGQRLLEQARRDARVPQGTIHRKEVFL